MIFYTIIAIVIGYLLGSIPFAYIAGRLKKVVDIRQVGGGNMGVLNTIRQIGPAVGFPVLVADIAKGAVAVLIARWLDISLIWIFVAGFAAIVGHNWPVFLKFRGGKGAAATLGVLAALFPIELVISFGIIIVVVIITSNVRLAIFIGLAFLPIIVWRLNGSGISIAYSLALPIFLGLRALTDFQRDMNVNEKRKGLIFDKEYHFWQTRKGK